jgi:hypothetical protein
MDPDWEEGMWNIHGLVNVGAISGQPSRIVEETDAYRIVRTGLGALIKEEQAGQFDPNAPGACPEADAGGLAAVQEDARSG